MSDAPRNSVTTLGLGLVKATAVPGLAGTALTCPGVLDWDPACNTPWPYPDWRRLTELNTPPVDQQHVLCPKPYSGDTDAGEACVLDNRTMVYLEPWLNLSPALFRRTFLTSEQ